MRNKIIKYALASFWPVFVFIFGAGFFFRAAVVDSIQSSSEPAVVYSIIGALFVGIFMLVYVLVVYVREESLFLLFKKSREQGGAKESFLKRKSMWSHVYELLSSDMPAEIVAPVLQVEVEKSKNQFDGVMKYPTYIAGALVGLGLLGTFIGLLGTLRDLAAVFGFMAKIGSGNALEMFGDMIQKLQDPIKGMGTAFVASLYGLMGSLILGVMVLTIKSIGHTICLNIEGYIESVLAKKRMQDIAGQGATSNAGKSSTSVLLESIRALSTSIVNLSNQMDKGVELQECRTLTEPLKSRFFGMNASKILVTLLCFVIALMAFELFYKDVIPSPNTQTPKAEFSHDNKIVVSSAEHGPKAEPVKGEQNAKPLLRIIKKGDSFYAIALECKIPLKELISLNPNYKNNPDQMMLGAYIAVPDAACAKGE